MRALKFHGICPRSQVRDLRKSLVANGYTVTGYLKDGRIVATLDTGERVFSAMDMRGAWSVLALPGLLEPCPDGGPNE